MFTTFLMAALLTLAVVALSALAVYLFAEVKWSRHPMSRCTYRRAVSFARA